MASCSGDHDDALLVSRPDLTVLPPLGLGGSLATITGEAIPPSVVVPLSLSVLSFADASSTASSSRSAPLLRSTCPCATIKPPKSVSTLCLPSNSTSIPPSAFVEGEVPTWIRESHSKEACDKISKGGDRDTETGEENHAIHAAGNRARQEQTKQKAIDDLPRFELPENATRDDLIKFLKKRFARYEDLKSFDICGMAVVTPPTDIVTYHIVEITRPSEDNCRTFKSVLQLLARETDNYIIGFRRTPGTPTDKDGFFLYADADIIVPEFFGVSHKLPCGSSYRLPNKIQIFKNMMTYMVESLLRVNVDNCKYIKNDTRQMMETSMLILGECERMQAPLDFVMTNYTRESRINLSSEVIMYMKNWSYLSKAIFAFYLGMLEVAMGVDGSKETYLKGRRSVAAAVKKFADRGYSLDLTDGHGFFSLKRLARDCVRLVKYDETYVKKLIMIRNQKYNAQFEHIKHPRNDEKDQKIDDESNKAEEEKEWQFLKQEGENLIKKLLEQYGEEEKCDPWKRSYPRKVV